MDTVLVLKLPRIRQEKEESLTQVEFFGTLQSMHHS